MHNTDLHHCNLHIVTDLCFKSKCSIIESDCKKDMNKNKYLCA